MINRIISFSIRHKFVVVLLVLLIIGGGAYSLHTINVDSTPDITNNQVQVITTAENLSTEDIEQFVTYPVELAMSNLPGVTDVRSISRFGLSVVTVVFKDNMGTYLPRQLVQEKLSEVKEQIPAGFGTPEMGPITTGLGEIFQYTLVPKDTAQYTPQELRTIQDWIVKRQMAMIPGVVEVNSFGGSIKQYEISLSSERLNAMGISISEVFEALNKNNVNTGGAYIEKDHKANFIRGEGLVKSIDDIKSILVKKENGIPVLIRDVAEDVRFGEQVRYGAFTQDGHEAVGGMILMLKGANSDKVVTAVKDRIQSVQKSLPAGIEIKPFLDRSNLIDRTTSTIARNLIEGALIVIFVLVILLGNIRGGLITASVIPLALLFAFILMRIFGVWANLMSLGAIDFGIIVDGAVIIVEGITHKIETSSKNLNFSRATMDKISYDSASTMMGSAFFGQLIILIVFTPILFLSGISGKMFQPMAFTFSFAILGAIILCLTYVPMVSSIVMRPAKNPDSIYARAERWIGSLSAKIMHKIHAAYEPVLEFSLKHTKAILLTAVALLGVTGVTFSQMGGEFVPSLDEGDIAMQAFLRPGSSLSETVKREEEVERLLLKNFPEIKTVCARIGVADIPTDPMGFDYTDSFIILEKDMSKWKSAKTKEELIEKIKKKLNELPGLNFSFSQPVELRFNELLTGIREDVAVKLYGDDLDTLNDLGERMVSIISKIKGAKDVSLERTAGLPQITVKYDLRKIAQYGLNIEKLNQYVSAAFAGSKAGVIFEGEKRFDMVIRLAPTERKSIEDLQNLYVDLPDSQLIPLKEVANISYQPGPMQISRDQASRRIYVGVNVRGRDVQSLVQEIQQKLDKELKLPAGYRITYGGEFQNLQDAKARLMVVMPIAMLLIFILLYFALKSVKQALMIYIAVPLAAIGGVFSLVLRGMPFSISAGVGFIVLFGVAVLNGLVLINRFNSLKDEGETDVRERIRRGTRERLRPILLTATAAMLGFLPMAVSGSAGAEVQRPLATVVIGGLFSATLLTLIIVPILYALEEKIGKPHLHKKNVASTIAVIAAILIPSAIKAQQPISLADAVKMASETYPSIKAARMNVEAQQELKRTAWDIGTTEIATGAEEKGKGNDAITTLISVRQNLDILGISARAKYYGDQAELSRAQMAVTERELRREVSIDYGIAYVAHQRRLVYAHLDSIYRNFENAARLRYETEATSRLEYISAQNQARQIALMQQQSIHNEQIALKNLNRWLSDSSTYVTDGSIAAMSTEIAPTGSLHPTLQLANQKILAAESKYKMEKSEFLPKFFVEYGSQKIGSATGYYSYQVGLSVPLFFGAQSGRTKSAKIERDIAQIDYSLRQRELNAQRTALADACEKWRSSLKYYRETALPLAKDQEQAAIQYYNKGATDYIGFIQNMKDATQIQFEYWNCFSEYLNAKFDLEYCY